MFFVYGSREGDSLAADLDSLRRIVKTRATAEHRIAFGRKLREAFLVPVGSYNTGVSVAGRWLEGKEGILTEVLGNPTAFFEGLLGTTASTEIVGAPSLIGQIDEQRRVDFILRHLDTCPQTSPIDFQLLRNDLSHPEVQRFVSRLYQRYASKPDHTIWSSLGTEFDRQISGGFWQYLSDEECLQLLETVAKAQPHLMLTVKRRLLGYMVRMRHGQEASTHLYDVAVSNMAPDKASANVDLEPAFRLAVIVRSLRSGQSLQVPWMSQYIHQLAEVRERLTGLENYEASCLSAGLRYCAHTAKEYRKWQYDLTPLLRMQQWCYEALLAKGFVAVTAELDLKQRDSYSYVTRYRGVTYRLPRGLLVETGARLLILPGPVSLSSDSCCELPDF